MSKRFARKAYSKLLIILDHKLWHSSRQIDSENGEIARRKSEAEEAVSILRDNANRVALSERRNNGMFILP